MSYYSFCTIKWQRMRVELATKTDVTVWTYLSSYKITSVPLLIHYCRRENISIPLTESIK